MKNLESEKQAKSRSLFVDIIIFVMAVLIFAGLYIANMDDCCYGSAKQKTSKAFISSTLKTAFETYHSDVGVFPESLIELKENLNNRVGWKGPYVEDSIQFIDPWGNDYQYQSPRREGKGWYDLWSNGPDGQSGTADDIGNWE